MYIWCAIDLDRQLSELHSAAEKVSLEMGACNPALTLPLHISLKISCEVEDCRFDEAVDEISAFFSGESSFEITPICIERCGGVTWIRYRETPELSSLHEWLVALFRDKYGARPHEFDFEFAYHTSLFVGNEEEATRAFTLLKDEPLPQRLTADRYVIGVSESGKAGEYRVIKSAECRV